MKTKEKRYKVYDDKNNWYVHCEYKTRSSAIRCASELASAGIKTHVVDTQDNTVVWG